MKKMYLVSEDQMNSSRYVAPPTAAQLDRYKAPLFDADRDMHVALNDATLSNAAKVKVLSDALDRFKSYARQATQVDGPQPRVKSPTRSPSPSPKASREAIRTHKSPGKDSVEAAIDLLPKAQREKARAIVDFAVRQGHLSVDDKNVPSIGGKTINNGNLVDLLAWMTARGNPRRDQQPSAILPFLSVLADANAQSSLVVNVNRRGYFQNLKHETTSVHTPIASRKAKWKSY